MHDLIHMRELEGRLCKIFEHDDRGIRALIKKLNKVLGKGRLAYIEDSATEYKNRTSHGARKDAILITKQHKSSDTVAYMRLTGETISVLLVFNDMTRDDVEGVFTAIKVLEG